MRRTTRTDLNTEIMTAIEELRELGNGDPLTGDIAHHLQEQHPESNVKYNLGYIWSFLADSDELRRKSR